MISEYFVSNDKKLFDGALFHQWISQQTYWGKGRSPEESALALENSLYVFGIYRRPDGGQLGCARLVSDGLTMGYLVDVFILPELRGKGLGKLLLGSIIAHPPIANLRRLSLFTQVPEFYREFFTAEADPSSVFMHRKQF